MKVVISILLAIIVVLAWLFTSELATNKQQHTQLSTQLADKTKLENLQLQEKCTQQAEKMFHTLGYKVNQPNADVDTYQSHYNQKLEKCFMTIESSSLTTGFINKVMLDAFEQREYAEYTWMPQGDKKYWEVPPKICKLIVSTKNEQTCKSDDEYKAFIATYIE